MRKFIILLFVIVSLSIFTVACNNSKVELVSPLPSETPETIKPGVIENNRFKSELLGMEMALPRNWYLYSNNADKNSAPAFTVYNVSTVSDENIECIISQDNVTAMFYLDKYSGENEEDKVAHFWFISSEKENSNISCAAALEEWKNGFNPEIEQSLTDLPDLEFDNLLIKRFTRTKPFESTVSEVYHLFLLDDYTVSIVCTYDDDEDYMEMIEIMSTIKVY